VNEVTGISVVQRRREAEYLNAGDFTSLETTTNIAFCSNGYQQNFMTSYNNNNNNNNNNKQQLT